MQNINDSINKIKILKITSVIIFILLSFLLFFKGIRPLEKEINIITEKIQESSKQLNSKDLTHKEIPAEIEFDNKIYDKFYKDIVEFSKVNNIDYLSLENSYDNLYEATTTFPMITNTRLEIGNLDLLDDLKTIISNKLLDFTLNNDDKAYVDLKNLFIFDKSFSHKDLTIDNRQIEALEENIIETKGEDQEGASESKSGQNEGPAGTNEEKEIEKKEEFSLIDFSKENIGIVCTPMHESISVEGKYQIAPIKNYKSYVVNIYNNSDENGSALISFKDKHIKLFTGQIDILLKCDLFNNINQNIDLFVTDYYGEIKTINGSYKDDKFIFNIDDKYNFPLEIYGIKFNIIDKSSTSFAFENLNLEIKSDMYNEILKNGVIRTVSKDNEKSIDEFIDNISGGVIKQEFINDNQLKESEFKDKKVFLVRFRNIYEIK